MDKQTRENISKLKAKGFLERKGTDRGGKWVILKVNNELKILVMEQFGLNYAGHNEA